MISPGAPASLGTSPWRHAQAGKYVLPSWGWRCDKAATPCPEQPRVSGLGSRVGPRRDLPGKPRGCTPCWALGPSGGGCVRCRRCPGDLLREDSNPLRRGLGRHGNPLPSCGLCSRTHFRAVASQATGPALSGGSLGTRAGEPRALGRQRALCRAGSTAPPGAWAVTVLSAHPPRTSQGTSASCASSRGHVPALVGKQEGFTPSQPAPGSRGRQFWSRSSRFPVCTSEPQYPHKPPSAPWSPRY